MLAKGRVEVVFPSNAAASSAAKSMRHEGKVKNRSKAKISDTVSNVASGPVMPRCIGVQPVALAAHVISNMVLVPST